MSLLPALAAIALTAAGCSPPPPAHLSESQAELVSVLPSVSGGNFGDVQVGGTAAPMTIRVAPLGAVDSYDEVSAVVEACPNFSVDPGPLPREVSKTCVGGGGNPRVLTAGAPVGTNVLCSGGYEIIDYVFPASFAPTVAGMQSCVVTVVLGNETKTITLMGNGLPPPRDIDLSRASVAFGDVRRNAASTPQAIVVSNTGSADLTISSATVNSVAFTMMGATTTIPGNSSYTYQLSCTPQNNLGPLNGLFTVVSDDPDEGTVAIPLSCNGVDSALDVQPSPIALPPARVAEPKELTVTLRNSGGAAMTVTSVSITGTDLELVNPPSGDIPAGGSVQARVRYMANTEADINGMLSVQFDGQTRNVAVSARAKLAALSISPDGDVDLGAVCVGSSKDKSFVALGAGGAPFTISSVRVSGAGLALISGAGPFNVAGSGATTTTLTARVAPTQPGPVAGMMVVTTDIPNAPTRTLALTASAIAQGVGAAPAEFDFDSIEVNEPSSVQAISIANCSGGALTVAGATLEGPDAADFRIITEPAKTVQPADTTSLLIEMRPRTPGPKTATLVITHSSGTTSVALTGDGFLPAVPVERIGTYYACSTQDGSGAWMIGVCVVVLGLRRRRRS